VIEFDPYGAEYTKDPYPFYARLRDEAPVFHNSKLNFWALSRYHDIIAAHADDRTFISSSGVSIEGYEASMPLIIVQDRPAHGWAKSLVVKMFSRPRMVALDAFIRERAVSLLESLYEKHGPDGEFDMVSEFAVALPMSVICELLGIPEELRGEIHRLSNESVSRGGNDDHSISVNAQKKMLELYTDLAKDRRANPRDDIISILIAEEVVDDQGATHRMSDHEIAVRFLEMGFAGHETVSKAIPNGAMSFQRNPEQWTALLQNPSLIENAVDEILRYEPPSQLQGRTTSRDVKLHGTVIPAGQRVMLLTGSAARDPRAFADPDRFDISRQIDPRSIQFGYGVHKCLGIHLARREMTIVFEELMRRAPKFSVDPNRATRAVMTNVRGVGFLPMRLGTASAHKNRVNTEEERK
jgi:cytochrome P450